MGIEVVGWTGDVDGELTRESVASHLLASTRGAGVHRVIVAMPDRRGTLPVEELLDLRLAGLKVEEATSWLEKMSGRIEVEHLYPSWLIFAEGFRFSSFFRLMRRLLNFSVALTALVFSLPLLPFIVLAVKLGSPGPALYHQRTGRAARDVFFCLTSSVPCGSMRKPTPAPLGLPTTIRGSPAWANFCAPRGLMRFRNYGAC